MSFHGEETYYDLLKVDPRASVAEIVSAYHAAKNAFAKDSLATYSLFSDTEVRDILSKLEEAYLTLSNLERRADYDRRLTEPLSNIGKGPVTPSLEVTTSIPEPTLEMAPSEPEPQAPTVPLEEKTPSNLDECSGSFLKDLRVQRGLSVEDVCRITKIPSKAVKAIEQDDFKNLPARVYIQGFIKNLAVLYKVDAIATAKAYLAFLSRRVP